MSLILCWSYTIIVVLVTRNYCCISHAFIVVFGRAIRVIFRLVYLDLCLVFDTYLVSHLELYLFLHTFNCNCLLHPMMMMMMSFTSIAVFGLISRATFGLC